MTKPKMILQYPGVVERVHKHKITLRVATNFGDVVNWVPKTMVGSRSRKKGSTIVLRTWEKGDRIWCTVGKRVVRKMSDAQLRRGLARLMNPETA